MNFAGDNLIRQPIRGHPYRLLLILLFAVPSLAFAQTRLVIRPSALLQNSDGGESRPVQPPGRPKIGLVLSGGGGRGLAQIGVLRALERHQIPIDLIVGNSLGSVVGGLYASGYTTTELESLAIHTNWSELLSFAEETKRTDLYVGQKQDQQEGFLLIRFDGLEPIIPSAISGGQRLSNYFSYLTLQALYHPDPTFDQLKIPFRATATDLLSGRRVIMDRGSLSEAMRSSITVPLLYSPLERDSMLLVDGGLLSNIPADVAKSLGCDIVIVVNSTSSMRRENQLGAPWEIADQIMTIMMQQSNREEMKLADVVITPPAGNRIVSDFSNVDTLLKSGDRAGEEAVPKILNVIHEHTRIVSSLAVDPFDRIDVRFQGDSIAGDIRREIVDDAGERRLSPRRIEDFVDRIYATGRYRSVYAELNEETPLPEVVYYTAFYPAIADIRFTGNQLISDQTIKAALASSGSRSMDPPDVRTTIENVLSVYRKRGYSLARVDSVRLDTAARALSFAINEGKIVAIRYEGNDRTRDYVIRREFPMDVGDIFSIDKANQGIANIRSTGLFDYVLLDIRYEGNQPVIILKVKEKSAELLRLGLHADNEHGVVTTVDARDANFRGAWEDLGIVLRYGSRDRGARAEYTINRIFNTYLTFNMNFYLQSRDILTYTDDPTLGPRQWDRIEEGRYQEGRYGATLAFGSHVERLGEVTAELRWENQKITGLSGIGYTPEQYRFVAIKLRSILDTEDKFTFATRGMLFTLTYESAAKGLGSEVSFGKFGVSYETYLTPLTRHTLRPKFTFGFADQTLPIAEQYSLGGFNSFFGLRENDSRGRQLFLINMEYRFWFPFKLIFETYLKARYDLGTISLVPQELTLSSFRHGLGAEIALDTPLGQASFGMGKSFYFRRDLPNSPATVGPLLLYFSIGSSL